MNDAHLYRAKNDFHLISQHTFAPLPRFSGYESPMLSGGSSLFLPESGRKRARRSYSFIFAPWRYHVLRVQSQALITQNRNNFGNAFKIRAGVGKHINSEFGCLILWVTVAGAVGALFPRKIGKRVKRVQLNMDGVLSGIAPKNALAGDCDAIVRGFRAGSEA
jgi:hypothetical protein